MIGHRGRFRENDDLLLWRDPAVKKKPPFSDARALITRKFMRSRDAQCNTGECASSNFNLEIKKGKVYIASEQQHNQDLKEYIKREYEFSNSSLFTRMHCI